jgi:hypothetical protein
LPSRIASCRYCKLVELALMKGKTLEEMGCTRNNA